MQTFPTFCTLTKDWCSHRGKLYPAGTTFKRNKSSSFPNRIDGPGHWYEFKIPAAAAFPHWAGSFGFVFIPDKVFFLPTEEELTLRETRKKLREDHMKSYELL